MTELIANIRRMADNTPSDFVWRPKTNKSFIARCHVESGNTWLRFGFDSEIGRIERPQDIHGNPKFIISANKKTVALKGTVILPRQDTRQMGEVVFSPKEAGVTTWKWKLTRGSATYSGKGRGIFRLDGPQPVKRARAKKTAR